MKQNHKSLWIIGNNNFNNKIILVIELLLIIILLNSNIDCNSGMLLGMYMWYFFTDIQNKM